EPVAQQIKRPRPEKAKIDKCIKEWQVGPNRVNQLVNWLCDPFGDSDLSGDAPAVLTTMPSQSSLKQGDQVIGVVVGVMPFGVFVELAPDCSGLVHVSKVTDTFVEDLHEAIQVGDVVTAWVTSVDTKKKRVALSAISPEREAELAEQRRHAKSGSGRGHSGSHGGQRGSARGGQAGGQARSGGQSRGGQSRGGGQDRAAQSGGGQGQDRGGQGRGSQGRGGQGRGGQSRGGQGRGGQSRGGQGRGRQGGRGRFEKKPESYNVVGKKEESNISDAMQKGDEPLRSFGDLMQFYTKKDDAPAKPSKKTPAPPTASKSDSGEDSGAENKPESATAQPAVGRDETPPQDSDPAASANVASESESQPATVASHTAADSGDAATPTDTNPKPPTPSTDKPSS
ncbi:MAG: S1 RNA-binding domain-containing protein, partial [Pirellulaceae bacterium]|nr:S1 RNA-binding domain-containing protein [Pirellulaceae bacterium]